MEDNNKIKHTGGGQISVIVPVYKVEPYLRQCIDSILAQTFTDFELILVDDGSPDNCGAICDEYAAKDERIVVIHQENGGLSAARNAVLDWMFANSDSEWITFVDSDDCLVTTCLEHLHKSAIDTKVDIVTTNGHWFSDETELSKAPEHVINILSLEGKQCCLSFYNNEMLCSAYAWGKLYKKQLFKNRRYAKGKLFEDEELTPKLLYEAEKVTILRSWLYCYRQRNGSIVHDLFNLRRFDHLDAMKSCRDFFLQKDEKQIVDAIEKRMRLHIAKYMLLAHGAGMADRVPAEYRMPLWKAFCISVADTLSHGGMDFVVQRIKNYFGRIKRD